MRKPVMSYANNKGADQPVHPHSLISTFVVRCLDSIILLVSISEISSVYLAAQAGLSLSWSQTPKTGFLVMRLICYGNLLVLLIKYKIGLTLEYIKIDEYRHHLQNISILKGFWMFIDKILITI